jgi:putative ATP-dependent endonuclease of OLD family
MQVRRLEIENFRGIAKLTMCPQPGINVILGPGDAGKTTILDAISLALSPQPTQAAAETDYPNLDTTEPFRIGLVIGELTDSVTGMVFPPPLWGWDARTCELHPAPDDELGRESVLAVQLVATPDLELEYRLLQSGNEPRPLSVATRAAIGLWNVGTDRRPDSQLRMSRGSLLERAVGRERLRAPALAAMQSTADTLEVPEDASEAIARVSEQLRAAGVQFEELALSLVASSGQSPVQLVTLVAKSEAGHVPLANFGRGSQQMAMVTLALAQIAANPIAVIDELEAGLEPYRQRALLSRVRSLTAGGGQAFVTSHSPAVIAGLHPNEVWRVTSGPPREIRLLSEHLNKLLRRDPEALLSRLPIVGEGATEVGILRAYFDDTSSDVSALGVHLIDGGGHEPTLRVVRGLSELGGPVYALVDNEDFLTGTREEVAALPGVRLAVSHGGRCIECAVAMALPREKLEGLVSLPGTDGDHLDRVARAQEISSRLDSQSRVALDELLATHPPENVRSAIGEAAATKGWFKTESAGEELGRFMIQNLPAEGILSQQLRRLVGDALTSLEHRADGAQP